MSTVNTPHTASDATPVVIRRRGLWLSFLALATFVVALAALYGIVVQPVLAGDADRPLQAQYFGTCEDAAGLGLVVAGAGLDSVTSSSITNFNVPGTVITAWVYYNGRDDTNDTQTGGDSTVTFTVGSTDHVLSPTLFAGPALWPKASSEWSYLYKADVTPWVTTGVNTYTLSGVDSFLFNNGWELVVLYSDPSRRPHRIAVAEGLDLADGDNNPASGPGIEPVLFTFDPAAVTRTAQLASVAGAVITTQTDSDLYYQIGYGTPPVTVTDIYTTGTLLSGNPFTDSDGFYWDTYRDSIDIPPNATYVIFQARSQRLNPSLAAELEWILQTLSFEEACPEVGITKDVVDPPSGPASVGEPVSFEILVENLGNTELLTVELVDTFDSSLLSFTGSQPTAPDAQATGVLTWTDVTGAGSMQPSDQILYTVTFQALDTTDITTNTATAV
ncbi:MAG: hypothetical protein D6775_16415, partial [Caldilineae bacterium]